jgi:glutamate--cysteine ligase
VLAELHQEGESFFEFALRMSRQHREYFQMMPPMSPARLEEFSVAAKSSLQAQHEIEAAESEPFEEYLAQYFAEPVN